MYLGRSVPVSYVLVSPFVLDVILSIPDLPITVYLPPFDLAVPSLTPVVVALDVARVATISYP